MDHPRAEAAERCAASTSVPGGDPAGVGGGGPPEETHATSLSAPSGRRRPTRIRRGGVPGGATLWWAYMLMLAGCLPDGASVVSITPPVVPVEVALVKAGEMDEAWNLFGQVRSLAYATVAVQATGEVRKVEVSEGTVIDQGALLLEVDNAVVKAQMDRVKIEADVAAANGEGRAAVLKAQIEELSVALVRHEVRAPFRGVIAARYVDPGDWVYIGDPAFDLVMLGEVEIIVDGPAELIGDVQPGATASLVGPDTVLGEVIAVVPVRDPLTGTVRVRIKPGEPRPWLVHGAQVSVRLPISRTAEGMVVPRDALVRSENGPLVVRLSGDRAVRVPVTKLAWTDDEVLVRAGDLEAGDQVVVRGPDRLYTGQLIGVQVAP